MTLPFISYGGSSAMSVAMTMGMVLALTRHHVGPGRIAQRVATPYTPGSLLERHTP